MSKATQRERLYIVGIKLRLLPLYRWDWREWLNDVWRKDGLERQCCSGYMCGCYGSSNLDWWEYLLTRPKPDQK